ncbi:uncharacterized protein LOC143887195 [Tasmannia lanceolata]|uniref:uncharacterized protein LOC143887195 n=1 Tax=Tasmannia lanceolata TaxID=3420 RepID=UPI004062CD73
MGSGKEKPRRVVRGVKTLFFLLSMFISFLLFSAPVLLVISDAIIPSALFSAFLSPLSFQTLQTHLRNYDFRASIIDIPLISIIRSILIICVYCLCDGPGLSRGPYLGVTTLCSMASLAFVTFKACVFQAKINGVDGMMKIKESYLFVRESPAMEAMFFCSLVLAVGHVVVAYRTSCRERRKLLVYRIDLEAVSACKNGFPTYHKVLQVRAK